MSMLPKKNPASIDALNSLLRGEISAVETYDQVISKFPHEHQAELEECRTSHQTRIPLLSDRVHELGGTPATSSGTMGLFASLTEAGASLLGIDTAVRVLESGEDRGLANYRDAVEELDPESTRLVLDNLLPEQERSHRVMSDLKHGATSGSGRSQVP